jgi:hypothetical protein
VGVKAIVKRGSGILSTWRLALLKVIMNLSVSSRSIWSKSLVALFMVGNSILPGFAALVKIGDHNAFSVDSPVGSMTPVLRAKVMQKNVDNALVASSDKSPNAVSITVVNGQPVLTLGGFYVASADANSAKKLGITKMAVAQRWQSGLKQALSNSASVQAYIGNLTGGGHGPQAGMMTTQSGSFPFYKSGKLVFVPAGMMLPVLIRTPLSSDTARPGDQIEATLAQPVALGDSELPMQTILTGVVTEAAPGTGMSHSGALGLKFNTMQLPNSDPTPISAHIVGRLGNYEPREGAVDTFRGENTNHKIEDAVVRGGLGVGAGAIAGTVLGAIAGGGRGAGRGAIAGLSIGGALGVADSLMLRKGSNVKVQSGQALNLQLDAPAQIEAAQASYGNSQQANYGSQQQNYGSQQSPSYGSQQQNYGSQRSPNYGSQQSPNYGSQQSPNYGSQQQNYGSQQSQYGSSPQNYGSPQSQYGGQSQNYGSQNYGSQQNGSQPPSRSYR